jgi:hypothetical protein
VIGINRQPHTALLIVRNEDGTPEKVRVTGKNARYEARLVKAAIQHHGDRVLSVHDSSGKALYSQGAWPESPAGDAGGRTVTEPRPQPAPAPPAVAHAMDRETEPSHLVVPKSAVTPEVEATHDAFAAGQGYETVAGQSPAAAPTLDQIEESAVKVHSFIGAGSGAVIAPGQVLTASHVSDLAGAPHTIADDPSRDVSVVEQDTGDAPSLPLATQAPAIGEEVTILSHKVGGAQTANVIQTGDYVALDTWVPGGTSGAPVVNSHGEIVSTVVEGAVEPSDGEYCGGPSAPAIREAIAVPEPERTAGEPMTGPQIPLDDDAMAAAHQPTISR